MKTLTKKTFYLLLAVALTATVAHADYNLYGLGSLPCREWMNKRTSDSWYEMGEWMLGFISAVGYYGIYTLKDADAQAFLKWMDAYCREKPQNEFADGVQKLVETLKAASPSR